MDEQELAHEEVEDRPAESEPPPSSPPPPAKPTSFWRLKTTRYFVGGFVGWFLLNMAVYAVFGVFSGVFIFPANVIVFIYLMWRKTTRQIAWGMLSAVGLNMIISLLLGLSTNAICWIPFVFMED